MKGLCFRSVALHSALVHLAVSGDFGGEVLDAARAAVFTQDVAIQRVAAPPLSFRRQQETAFLTDVTVDMKAAIQSYNPHRLLLPRLGHYRLTTHRASRRVLPMEVLDAVNLRGGVHSEGHPIQAAVTHHTREAARMVGLAHCPQDSVQYGLGAF